MLQHNEIISETKQPKNLSEQAEQLGLKYVKHYIHDEFQALYPEVAARIAKWDDLLVMNPGWEAPILSKDKELTIPPDNEVALQLYSDPVIFEWGKDMMEAKALIPLQRPLDEKLPGMFDVETGEYTEGLPVSEQAQKFFLSGLDAVAIRSRAKVMMETVEPYMDRKDSLEWTSIACGAALPVFEILEKQKNATGSVRFFDINQEALAHLHKYAKLYDLPESLEYSSHESNIIKDLLVSDKLIDEVGIDSQDVVDMMGIFEYFDQKASAKLLSQAYRMVAPGGVLIIGNMLKDRPQMEFNRRGVGWPNIFPRTLEDIRAILDASGVNSDAVTVRTAQDEVYAVVEIKK